MINDPNIKYKPSYQITGDIKQDYINNTIAREVSNTDSYNPNGYLELQYAYDIARKEELIVLLILYVMMIKIIKYLII